VLNGLDPVDLARELLSLACEVIPFGQKLPELGAKLIIPIGLCEGERQQPTDAGDGQQTSRGVKQDRSAYENNGPFGMLRGDHAEGHAEQK
jgi:hypothetical protein